MTEPQSAYLSNGSFLVFLVFSRTALPLHREGASALVAVTFLWALARARTVAVNQTHSACWGLEYACICRKHR